MKRKSLWYTIVTIVGVAAILSIGFAAAAKKNTIQSYSGVVEISKDNGKKWIKVSADMEVQNKDIIRTKDKSSCEILIPDLGVFRVGPNTQATLDNLTGKDKKVAVKSGAVGINVKIKLKPGETFKVETDTAVAEVRGTIFAIEADSEKTKATCAEGEVELLRNVNIPAGDADLAELQSMLKVKIKANKEIEMTMQENKELENLLQKAKKNMAEVKDILKQYNSKDLMKIRLAKKAQNLIDELSGDGSGGNLDQFFEDEDKDDGDGGTDDLMNKIKK
ncbi:MAG: FecR domain-containing protein [Brevinematales bacterium]|nr:FecR domain-containing protein [Brevinematales bacterium]